MSDLISRADAIKALDAEFRCTDNSDDWNGLRTAMLIIEELPSVQHWIPCADRLPDTDCRVLCLTKTKKGIINYVIGYYADDRWCCGMNSNVVAWMELPAPPEEDKQ